MQGTLSQYMAVMGANSDRKAVRAVAENVGGRLNTQALTTAGLVISATTTKAKTGAAAFYALVGGRLVTIAAGTDMPALTGLNITATYYNVAAFFIDAASTVTVRFGTEATAIAGVKFPDFPLGQALVGFLLITYASAFTGGTTVLSTATTVYVSPLGAVDPTIIY